MKETGRGLFFIWRGFTSNNIIAYTAIGLGLAIVLLVIALYLRRVKKIRKKRIKFLLSVYQKFYENKDLIEIREWLDSGPVRTQKDYDIEKAKKDKYEGKFDEKFTNYLNFFKFVVILRELRRIRQNEIEQMFGHYLTSLKNNGFIMKYLKDNGYNELEPFLLNYKGKE